LRSNGSKAESRRAHCALPQRSWRVAFPMSARGVSARGNGNASRGKDNTARRRGKDNTKDEAKGKPGNVEQLDERRNAGSGGARAKEPPKAANPPKEEEPAPRKKAHRWT
jgi:hypothetical protein